MNSNKIFILFKCWSWKVSRSQTSRLLNFTLSVLDDFLALGLQGFKFPQLNVCWSLKIQDFLSSRLQTSRFISFRLPRHLSDFCWLSNHQVSRPDLLRLLHYKAAGTWKLQLLDFKTITEVWLLKHLTLRSSGFQISNVIAFMALNTSRFQVFKVCFHRSFRSLQPQVFKIFSLKVSFCPKLLINDRLTAQRNTFKTKKCPYFLKIS